MLTVVSYSIYHSPNSYLGILLAERALGELAVTVERRPICIPRARGVKVGDLVGGKEPPVQSAYHREDCRRWAERYGIELRFPPAGVFEQRAARWASSPYAREELPARAYYAARGTGREAALDRGLFHAAWVDGLDVNDEDVVRRAAQAAGLDAGALLSGALQDEAGRAVYEALGAFDRDGCPGVPTWIVDGERFWGKDRVQWLAETIRSKAAAESG